MVLVQVGDNSWINPADVVAVVRNTDEALVIELRTGNKIIGGKVDLSELRRVAEAICNAGNRP